MKCTSALSLALAPLALAKATHNNYPLRRNGHLSNVGGAAGVSLGGVGGVGVAAELGAIAAVGSTQVIIIWANPGNNAATTTLNQQVTVTQTVTEGAQATAIASSSAAAVGAMATHTVIVGGSAGLVYTPAEIQANVGDMVVFDFMSMNHTVTQSTFPAPCDAMEGGMDSGFQANPNNTVDPPPQVAMQVMTTEPLWFYCKQMGHCGKGMVFSINPTAEKSQATFQSAAIAQKGQGAGSAITGNATASAGADAAAGAGAVASSAAAASGVAQASNVLSGAGSIQTGACVCAVTCGTGSFPAVAAQGLNNFGGIAGGLPASMMETV